MSYRDHLEAQKKYIQTKKEAQQAKEDRKKNPRPPRLDPPPAPTSPWLFVAIVVLMLLPLATFVLILPGAVPTGAENRGLTVWVLGTEPEFEQIKNWLEPEILANGLEWDIDYADSRQDVLHSVATGSVADLLIIEADLAEELYLGQVLAPFWDKLEGGTWENCFIPFWEPKPFQKSLGWVIPRAGNVEDARHLYTVLRQFAPPFKP